MSSVALYARVSIDDKRQGSPCVRKHSKGALEAGATVKEPSCILALTMRGSAGADDCWTHDVLRIGRIS